MQHEKTWWYKLAERWFPQRCREIPEPQNPDRIILRQFALNYRHWYLQQFCGPEDPRWMHSHQWEHCYALGLWGSYTEVRIAGRPKRRRAPYFYHIDSSVVHHVQDPKPGHTSLFLGLWRDDDLKHYHGAPQTLADKSAVEPTTLRRTWENHITKMVKRI